MWGRENPESPTCFVLGVFKTVNPLWAPPGKSQRHAWEAGGAAHEIYPLPDSQVERPSEPHFSSESGRPVALAARCLGEE